ncbi:MAG: high-affinity iron transporter [Candidatus Buchananbacteria bacterium RIFCSPHIGHO2_02_FULL_40_13]|uniref:High-affinity iron transporter n=1 Tax=Candidatus Buchananbacteria bacterium RIFCSPLOWO2_01_FULL_39_33 TaxID=1797543 RepID=A0A1G1YMS6_9BACT|nr:MAG: high-affinity iron transporter [Candidatus Buchananbacteria bacterium RIFCSPHIGHO2_01_FULL_40_35]OGY50893.1 MAG: high-affinity iron transporter [Candidatus Buchananbacteria bacterium RIFCSPHIGHO2_02_FULL_40_13]OGY52960.1 MAG: high-affinity iron transporter [Candidatus Buchananbacteria bacterium RIFCSPLOWO2_01_FULL_39_33]
MIASLIIALRETLEAALIIGIIIGYLNRTGQARHKKTVWLAAVLAIIASLVGAWLFKVLAGGFTGRAEEIFEGLTMLIGSVLLTTMILWMMNQKKMSQQLQERVAEQVIKPQDLGLFLLVFISILREGIETVIFLGSASLVAQDNNLIGAVLGLVIAVILGYAVFTGLMKAKLKMFFNITSLLLILFAAGLVAHGIHEFEEAGLIPIVIEHVWDINPALNPDGSYPALHENGWLGGLLKGLFGYNGNPSLIEIISYISYLLVLSIFIKKYYLTAKQ